MNEALEQVILRHDTWRGRSRCFSGLPLSANHDSPRSREDLLWSIEQSLRSTTCSAVFSWLGAGHYRYSELRKLQLAAAASDTLCALFRPQQAAADSAPAGLRLQMREYRKVHILKQRGGRQGLDVDLAPEDELPHQPQLWELPAWPPATAAGTALGAN